MLSGNIHICSPNDSTSSIHWLISLSLCYFLYNGVYYDVFKLSADDVLLNATLSAHDREHLEPCFNWMFYTPLYEKDTKQTQNNPIETTQPKHKAFIIQSCLNFFVRKT